MSAVKSIYWDEGEIILGIMALHNDGQPFEVDPCFSKGSFYIKNEVPMPRHRFDIMPVRPDVQRCDVRCLPLQDGSVGSVIFDPPFMFNPHGSALTRYAAERFTMFRTWDELVDCYTGALAEFWRVLRPGGIVAFKCQDYTDSRTTMTHCWVWRWAQEAGLYVKDLLIRARGVGDSGPAYNPALRQKHARKFHSYWLVLEKPQQRRKVM